MALQYSLRPSFLSMDRVATGREQNRALFHALEWRLRAMPADGRPRLVGFGESLGAQTMQDAFLSEGAQGFHRVGVDRALFLGTPATSTWAEQWRLLPEAADAGAEIVEIASYDEWLAAGSRDRRANRLHDYRADLARMVSVAFGLPVGEAELLSIERALRRREAEWAERRMSAEQLQRAKETAKRVVRSGSP